jgi:hypothetical protein
MNGYTATCDRLVWPAPQIGASREEIPQRNATAGGRPKTLVYIMANIAATDGNHHSCWSLVFAILIP